MPRSGPLAPLVLVLALAPAGRLSAADAVGVEFFEKKVRPVLVEHCYSCHSVQAKKKRGGLYLDSRAGLLKGGDSGPALVPGKPEQSLLVKALRHQGELKMPPKGALPAAVVADLARWVQMGAPAPEAAAAAREGIDWSAARKFWSFQPVRRPTIPTVRDTAWARGDLDRFVLARLEADGLKPVAAADRAALLRRVTFDLIGLPPTPAEVDTFVSDTRSDAYERVVDRLLASPRHGERWARHWLDVARYAEDQAHTFAVKLNTSAWRYRDWVIAALNADLPYDRFVTLQVAADLVPDATIPDRCALGFFGLGAVYYKNSNAAQVIAEELDDRVDTLSRGFLGLTVSCARCHDHKFDPIPTQDYYSLAGVFHSSRLADVPLAGKDEVERFTQAQKRAQEAERVLKDFLRTEKVRMAQTQADRLATYLVAAWKAKGKRQAAAALARQQGLEPAKLNRMVRLLDPSSRVARNAAFLARWRKMSGSEDEAQVARQARELQQQVLEVINRPGKAVRERDAFVEIFFGEKGVFAPSDGELTARLPADKKDTLARMRHDAGERKRAIPPAPPVAHGLTEGSPADLKVYIRGNPATPGAIAPRRFLRILAGDEAPRFTHGSGRLDLANALASKDNPLTARVIVNRLWMHHFGRGLVGTPSNFGSLGERPTHPELLDYLADELVRGGWSLKKLHRQIVLSATYRLGSSSDAVNEQKDPDNRLLWRMNRRRLDVESYRDALLAVSGAVDATMGGPTLPLSAPGNERRTVYARVSRHELDGLLRLFDFPDANITSEKRTETTVPQQQLFVLNSPFMIARARALAGRVTSAARGDAAIVLAYRLALGRAPAPDELRLGRLYLAGWDDPDEGPKNHLTRWQRYAQVLLGSNEFLYID